MALTNRMCESPRHSNIKYCIRLLRLPATTSLLTQLEDETDDATTFCCVSRCLLRCAWTFRRPSQAIATRIRQGFLDPGSLFKVVPPPRGAHHATTNRPPHHTHLQPSATRIPV